jgi:predicted acyl esterase
LWLSSSAADFAIHVYVSEIFPDGQSHYVTEGLLRALHRKESEPPSHYRTSWSFHSCERADALPMPINTPQLLTFALLPVSWTFKAGSKIMISFAGADADHCARIPADQPLRLKFLRGDEHPSSVTLPLRFLVT